MQELNVMLRQLRPRFSVGNLWPYLVMSGLMTTPRDVTWPRILMLYDLEDWKPQGKFLAVACWGIAAQLHHQNFFVRLEYPYELNVQIINSVLLQLSPQRTTSVTFIFSYQRAAINHHILHCRSCDWILEYQSLRIQQGPIPLSLSNQPLGQQQRTWLRSSHSGNKKIFV